MNNIANERKKGLSRDERRQLMDRAIVLTVIQIARRGLVVPA